MKQSAVEWLESKLTIEQWNELQDLLYEAKQMEAEQSQAITLQNQSESKDIPELSDKEIRELSNKMLDKFNWLDQQSYFHGAKSYREWVKAKK